ncbi:MAG: DUF6600 domain-containing protein, partial [Pseudomonadota bacterium]
MTEISRPLLIAGLAVSFLLHGPATAAWAQGGGSPGQASGDAQARVNIDVFYAPLAEHGTWVAHPEYDYVWVPSGLDASWRPYQEGRWIWTDAGWYWESGEPFAWATYHYGRWGYEPEYGWFWVPGDTWAPAWVKWRRGGERTGWAPIAPDARGFAYGAPKRYEAPVAESWVVVEDRYISAPDLGVRVEPIAQIGPWLEGDPREYDPVYRDGAMMTRFVAADAFAGIAATPVVTRQMVHVDRYNEEFIAPNGTYIGIYRPFVARGPAVAPPRYSREIAPDRRVVINQYVRTDGPGLSAPSAALLAVLGIQQRQDLRAARWDGDRQAYQRDLQRFRQSERGELEQRWSQSERNAQAFEQERTRAIRQREQAQQNVFQQRQQRADEVIQRLQRERPDALPATAPAGTPAATPAQSPGPEAPKPEVPNPRPPAGAPSTPQAVPPPPGAPAPGGPAERPAPPPGA